VKALLNIALCDDMPLLRGMLKSLIHDYENEKKVKFNIFQFDSGEELLETFDNNRSFFDVFFLDYHMKKLNGLQTATHIRQYDKKCVIVFVTSTNKRNELMTVEPLCIMQKIPDRQEIFATLDKALLLCKRPA